MKFRYSSISTFQDCPQRFKLQYLDLVPQPGPESGDLIFGTAIHAAIKVAFEGDDPVAFFEMYWGSVDPSKYRWTRYDHKALFDVGCKLLSKWHRLHFRHYTPTHVEHTVSFSYAGVDFEGTPDFIGLYKGVLSVVDWKTSASDYDKRKALVDAQTWLYVHAARVVHGLETKQVVYAPLVKYGEKVQNPICVPVTETKLKSMLDNAVMVCRDISTRTDWPRNGRNCLYCPYYEHCYKDEANEEKA